MEAWERVLVTRDYLSNPGPHGGACTQCHGGQSDRPGKAEAHAGLVKDPSSGDAPACRNENCHADIVTKHAASLHGTQNGYQTMFARRDAQPAARVEAMFSARCASCHTSCGQCHISRPVGVKGGLVSGHRFRREPSMVDNCTACHGSRVGAEFRGENRVGDRLLLGDAHYRAGQNCMNCHQGTELHGNGTTPALRYEVAEAPTCTDAECHSGVESDENQWHAVHGRAGSQTQLACQVCHAQAYKNCYECHVGLDSQGLEHPSRMDFRIGRNPIPSARRPWDFVVVRHIPIAPSSFAAWDVSMGSYAAEPTWRFATPHNIAKRAPQAWPDGYGSSGVSCMSGCHGKRELYLTQAYLDTLATEGVMFTEEMVANQGVTVGP